MINENRLAKRVSQLEAGKKETSIAQIKEILRSTLDVLAREYKMSEVVQLIEKHQAQPKDRVRRR